jgi:Cytidylate kinase-like family
MSQDDFNILKQYFTKMSDLATRRPKVPRPAITISRESGVGALTVANLAAQRLNRDCPGDPPCSWAVFDRNLLRKILEDHDLSERIEEYMPENARFPLSEAFEFLLGLHPPGWTLREYAQETIRKLAINGNVILVGRAGSIITARLKYVLHVRLVAPFEFRATNYARSNGISEKEAARVIRANDEASHDYVRLYFNTNVSDPLHYDLVVNTGRNGFERAAHLICAGVENLAAKGRREDRILHPAESFGGPDVQSEN